jgi:hypothetical protein
VATYDSAYLLSWFQRLAGRPPANDTVTTSSEYQRLTEAQNRVIAELAARAPEAFYPKNLAGAYPTLTTTDQKVFTFGTDSNGYPIFPIGKVGIYQNLSQIPDYPWIEGVDYLNEGNQIRIPNNMTYAGPLYWRGIVQPADIDATHQPTLIPEASRELIVYNAVMQFQLEGTGARSMEQATNAAGLYKDAFQRWCLVYRTQFRSGGALGPLTGRNLAITGVGGYGAFSQL